MVIRSRKLGKVLEFSRPGRGYIYVNINGGSGTLGRQICSGGKLTGSTIAYYGDDTEGFERICRRWYRQFLRQ